MEGKVLQLKYNKNNQINHQRKVLIDAIKMKLTVINSERRERESKRLKERDKNM